MVGCFLLLLYLLTFTGTVGGKNSDGRAMYMVTESLVDRQQVSIVPSWSGETLVTPGWRPLPLPTGVCATEPGVDGIGERPNGPFYTKYGIGQSLLAAPLYALGVVISRIFPLVAHGVPGIDQTEVREFVTSLYGSIVTALTATLLAALALRLGWSRPIALTLALLFGLATPAWAYTTTFFSEPTLGLCLTGAVAALLWSENGPTLLAGGVAGGWLGVALLTHVADSALYGAVLAAFMVWDARRRGIWQSLAAFAAPVAVMLILVAWYNQARFGGILATGYGIVGDHHDLHPPHTPRGLWEGVYGLLLSPGKGIFLYAPILFASAWAWPGFARRFRGGAWLCLGLVIMAVVGHANTLIVWLGGWAWGPRFMVPILPVALLPLGAWLAEGGRVVWRLTWALGVLGAIIQFPAVVLNYSAYIYYVRSEAPGNCIWTAEDMYKWHPRYSPLIGQWQRLFDSSTYRQAARPVAAQITSGRYTAAPQAWWRLLTDQGVSAWVPASIVVLIAAVALMLLAALIRMSRISAALPPAGFPNGDGGGSAPREVVRYR
jgi:hypothetical protein